VPVRVVVFHRPPNIQGNRRAALTLAKLKARIGASG
jgi:hypothetical protein